MIGFIANNILKTQTVYDYNIQYMESHAKLIAVINLIFFIIIQTMSFFASDLDDMDPKIETNLEKVCELDVSKFEPFESDLDHAIEDRTKENLMNKAIIDSDIDINLYTKFILVSWDVGRPGLWYSIERFGARKQFKTAEVNSER